MQTCYSELHEFHEIVVISLDELPLEFSKSSSLALHEYMCCLNSSVYTQLGVYNC